MIRVNLLPHAAERRTSTSEGGQTWLLVVMLAVVVEIVGLFFFHGTKEDELAEARAEVARVQSEITGIQSRVKDHEKIKAELETLRAREDAIAKLQAGRKGPTAVLLELSRVLTAGKGPTVDADKLEKLKASNPNARCSTRVGIPSASGSRSTPSPSETCVSRGSPATAATSTSSRSGSSSRSTSTR